MDEMNGSDEPIEYGECFNCGGPMNRYAARNASNNSTSSRPTHFLAAIELIIRARKEFKVESENWTYPILTFGYPNDPYYAEIWSDGMDWQNAYWLLETIGYDNPKASPLIIFNHHDEEEKIPQNDLFDLFRAIMWRRRDIHWIKQGTDGVYQDTVWCVLNKVNRKDVPENAGDDWEDVFKGGRPDMPLYTFGHANCPDVTFMLNESLTIRPKGSELKPRNIGFRNRLRPVEGDQKEKSDETPEADER